jgi:hypothetical protein
MPFWESKTGEIRARLGKGVTEHNWEMKILTGKRREGDDGAREAMTGRPSGGKSSYLFRAGKHACGISPALLCAPLRIVVSAERHAPASVLPRLPFPGLEGIVRATRLMPSRNGESPSAMDAWRAFLFIWGGTTYRRRSHEVAVALPGEPLHWLALISGGWRGMDDATDVDRQSLGETRYSRDPPGGGRKCRQHQALRRISQIAWLTGGREGDG